MSGTDPIDYLSRDPVLAPIIAEHGRLDIGPADDMFKRLIIAVINQQLSSASADAIRERVFEEIEVTPTGVLEADTQTLRDSGLSSQKTKYFRNVANAFHTEDYTRESFANLTDKEVIARVTDIKGIGLWSAKIFLIFCLGREDVFPVEDLGIRRGMEELYGDFDRDEMVQKAEDWQPYRSYASRYVWRAYD